MSEEFSEGKPNKKNETEVCIVEIMITNKFKEMMLRAHKAQEKILNRRLSKFDNWGAEDEREFKGIFGMDSDKKIVRKRIISGVAVDIENTAKEIITDGVKRIKVIHAEMFRTINEGGKQEFTCFYINNTACGNYTAKVMKGIDKNYQVYISGKFKTKNLAGRDSQVSTLCHEMSHFCRTGADGSGGGMATEDMDAMGHPAFLSEVNHLLAAKKLLGNQSVFESAYNIEKYFELELEPDELVEINEAVKNDMNKNIKILVSDVIPT